MSKSPLRSALQLTLAYALLSGAWILLNHFGPHILMVIDEQLIHHDAPIDVIFAALSSLLLFVVVHRYLVEQGRVQDILQRSHNEMEVRVEERTHDLEAERSKLRRILDTLPDGVCIIRQNYEMEYINPAMEGTWGEVAGRKCYAYFADRTLPCPHCRLAQIATERIVRWEWDAVACQRTYDVVGTILDEPRDDMATLYIFHDVTEQTAARRKIEEMSAERARQTEELRLAHAELSVRAQELATLLEISHTLASTLELQPLSGGILDQIRKMIKYSSAILYVFDDDGITAIAYRGALPDERVIGLHVPLAAAPGCQSLLERRQPIIIDDIQGDDPLARTILAAASTYFPQTMEATRAWMAVPLMVNDRVVAMLRLDHAQAGFFSPQDALLALAIANQAAVSMENARLYAEAHKVAVLEERQRMARDLHDSVSQALYGIALGTHAAREQLDRVPERLPGTLDYVLAMSATAVAEMRALVFELRPDSLEQEGLSAALAKQADALRARTGAAVSVEICEEPALALDGKEMLYRIAQEAMQNIAKHAHASHVNLRLQRQNAWVVLEVCDDGVGFDADGRFPGHYGLKTMHERTLRLRGTLEIESRPHAGSVVRARIPMTSQAA